MFSIDFYLFSANHVPILGVLKPGVVSVYDSDGNTKRFFGKIIRIELFEISNHMNSKIVEIIRLIYQCRIENENRNFYG